MTEEIKRLLEETRKATGCPTRFNEEKQIVEMYKDGDWHPVNILTEG